MNVSGILADVARGDFTQIASAIDRLINGPGAAQAGPAAAAPGGGDRSAEAPPSGEGPALQGQGGSLLDIQA